MREVLVETSVSSLGDMITAVADKHAKPQLELISRKRKTVEHDDDGDDGVDGDERASKQLRSESPRGIQHIQSEYAVYVRRVPLLIDIALQEEDPPICVGGLADPCDDSPSLRASASELHGDDEYFDTQVDEDNDDDDDDDDDDGSGYERSDRMDGDDVYPCDRPSGSCYPVDDDPFQHSVTVAPSTDVKSLIPHNAKGASRRLSDDFKRRVVSADITTRPPPIPASAPSPQETTLASSHTDREVRLDASCLRDRMEALGQADLKYIIARSCIGCSPPDPGVMAIERRHATGCHQRGGNSKASSSSAVSSSSSSSSSCSLCHNSSFLIALDQHAVDERIRYERSLTRLADHLIMTTVSNDDATTDGSLLRSVAVNIPLILSSRELAIATNRRPLLNSWLYRYRVVTVQEQCGELSEGGGSVVLEQVPEVLGVPLLQDDFRDFLLLINDGEELPDELLKPAAVLRVLASKACRGAVMFGDLLDVARCKGLVSELMSCSLPFNCAHGRPSMVPLVDLRPLRAYKLEECRVNRSRRRSRISI